MKAEVYFFQHKNNEQQTEIGCLLQTNYGVQLVLDGRLVNESNFLHTGYLFLDREKARQYGQAIGKKLSEKGIQKYYLQLNKKHKNLLCATGLENTVFYLLPEFKKGITEQLEKKQVTESS
jgi:hypothetical protein